MFNLCNIACSKRLSWPQLWSWVPRFSSAASFSSWGWRSSRVSHPGVESRQLVDLCDLFHMILQFTDISLPVLYILWWFLFSAPLCSDDKVQPSFLTSLKMMICHIPYQRLVLGFVFCVLAFQVQLNLSVVVLHSCKHKPIILYHLCTSALFLVLSF